MHTSSNQTEAAQNSAFSRDTDPTAVIDTASKPETITRINGNGKPYTVGLPKLYILGRFNDTALEHIAENTGLRFVPAGINGLEAQPDNSQQIAALFMTYNFKTRYYDNWDAKNTIMLKSDHHTGFDVDSICFDCVKANHIHAGGLQPGDRLSA